MEIYIYVIETYRECTFRIVRGKSKISSLICNITFYLPLAAVTSVVVIRDASSFQIHLPTIATLAGLRIHAQQRVDIHFHLCDSGKFISRFLCLVLLLCISLSLSVPLGSNNSTQTPNTRSLVDAFVELHLCLVYCVTMTSHRTYTLTVGWTCNCKVTKSLHWFKLIAIVFFHNFVRPNTIDKERPTPNEQTKTEEPNCKMAIKAENHSIASNSFKHISIFLFSFLHLLLLPSSSSSLFLVHIRLCVCVFVCLRQLIARKTRLSSGVCMKSNLD